jgi:IS30 family transposase
MSRIKRNKGYRPKQAQLKAENRRKLTAKPLKMTPEAIGLIDTKIIIAWSPE